MSKEYIKGDTAVKLKRYLFGLIIGTAVTVISAALFALVMYLFEIDSSFAVPFATVSLALGSFVASFFTSKKIGDRGYIVGLLIGTVIFIAVTLIALISSFDGVGINTLLRFIIIILASMIGGILGVNQGKNKKYI